MTEEKKKAETKELEFFKTWAVVNPEEHSKMRMHMLFSELETVINNHRIFMPPTLPSHLSYIDELEQEISFAKNCISSSINLTWPVEKNNKKYMFIEKNLF